MKNVATNLKSRLRFQTNPIIVKELRSRMRGPRAFIILTVVLALMGLISYALYEITLITTSWSYSPLSPQVGQTLFISLAVLEMLMVLIITPSITAGAISSEHEKLTYEMLLTTPLAPTRILWGKLVSALSYVFLLIFAAIPLASLVFIYGGVSLRDMLKAFIVVVCTAVMVGTIGVFMSTWLKRSGRATIFSYLIILALAVAPTFIYGIVAIIRQAEPPRWILVPSPISALMSAIVGSTTLGQSSIGMIGGLSMLLSGNINGFSTTSIPRPLYHYSLPLFGLITLSLYMLSTRLVRPARRWRLKRKEVISACLIILALAGLVGLAFGVSTDRYENISIFAAPTPFPMFGDESFMVEQSFMMEQAVPMIGQAIPDEEASTAYSNLIRAVSDQGVIPKGSVVFVSRLIYLDPSIPDGLQGNALTLSENIENKITESLADLPFEIVWLDGFSAFPPEGDTDSVEQGVLILLGNLDPLKTGNLQSFASLYFPDQTSQNLTYELSSASGVWQVINSNILE
ncbi:MAG: ABC transporter permease [Chloroflexi bacterium]|nr:ABC transporter permease [Chloroflexota bacterium]